MQNFYVDTCIYLNLWKKETEGLFKKQLWIIAKRFFEIAEQRNARIYYSGFILKELLFKISQDEFIKKKKLIEASPNFLRTKLTKEEYVMARRIEQEVKIKLSFFDIIHLLLARKTNSILITRDGELLKMAEKFRVIAKKPEEVI